VKTNGSSLLADHPIALGSDAFHIRFIMSLPHMYFYTSGRQRSKNMKVWPSASFLSFGSGDVSYMNGPFESAEDLHGDIISTQRFV
jgi:hypothetical protein